MNKVTYLLASHNGESCLKDQIDSILNQKSVAISLICSDDNSFDSSVNIIKSYPITLLGSKKFGSSANNFYYLITHSDIGDSDFVAFSDQDDIFFSEKTIVAISKMAEYNCDGYSCSTIAFSDHNFKRKILTQSNRTTNYDFLFEGAGQGCTFVISRKLFILLRQFIIDNVDICRNFYFHDWLTYLFCRSNNFNWYFDKTPYVLYRQHSSNVLGGRYSLKNFLTRFKYIYNGFYRSQINLAVLIYIKINANNSVINQFKIDFVSNNRINKFFFTLYNGRRKFLERLFCSIFILFGFI